MIFQWHGHGHCVVLMALVRLPRQVGVPENSNELHDQNLVVQRDYGEIRQLHPRPDVVIGNQDVLVIALQFLFDALDALALQCPNGTDEGGQEDGRASELVEQYLLYSAYRWRSSFDGFVEEAIPFA